VGLAPRKRFPRRLPAIVSLMTVTVAVLGADVAEAVTACTYNPATQTINITIDPGQSAGVAVESSDPGLDAESSAGAILFDVNGAGYEAGKLATECGSASNSNTAAIVVLGSDGAERFSIDALAGDELATSIQWAIDLESDPGDTFVVNAGDDDDEVVLTDGAFSLNGGGGDVVGLMNEQILGNGGDDTIDAFALTTSAELSGLDGFDTVTGGSGNDRLDGGDDDDRLVGGAGDDVLVGGDGVDRLYGGDGTDTCIQDRASGPCEPSIGVTPATAAAGDSLTLDGAGWYPENGVVDVAVIPPDGGPAESLGTLTPSIEDWTVEGTATAPSTAGDYTLIACQPCDEKDADRPTGVLTISRATLEPTVSVEPDTAVPGGSVVVSGEHWDPANGPISLFADLPNVPPDQAIATLSADESGHFEYELEIRGSASGRHDVTACQRCGEPDAIEKTTSFEVAAVGAAPTFRLRPSSGVAGNRVQATGEGWDPGGGRVRIFVDPTGAGDEPEATARVRPDGTFGVPLEVPRLDEGSYTVVACQRCNGPGRVEQPATLNVLASPSPLRWILLAAAVVLVAAAGVVAWKFRPQVPPGPVEVRLRHAELEIRVTAHGDGERHEVRLVPRADPGIQRVREGSFR
jgi:hypothetical protein